MKRFILCLVLACLIIPSSIVMASDISDAEYAGIIRISNNSSAAALVSVPVTGANTTNFINHGFLNAGSTNAAIQYSGADIAFMPGYLQPWVLFTPAINSNSYLNYTLYTNATGGHTRYFSDTGGMTVGDSPSIEPGANFTMSIGGFFNTDNGSAKEAIDKPSAVSLFVSANTSGTVTGLIESQSVSDNQDATDSNTNAVYGLNWKAQTFTANATTYVTAVAMRVYRVGSPGTVEMKLREISGGLPTSGNSTDLVSGTTNGDNITAGVGGEWRIVELDTPILVTGGSSYAVIIGAPSGGVGNQLVARHQSTAPYSGGQGATSSDGTASWAAQAAIDYGFRIYSGDYVTATSVPSDEHTITFANNNTEGLSFPSGVDTNRANVPLVADIDLGDRNVYSIECWARATSTSAASVLMQASTASNTQVVGIRFQSASTGLRFDHVADNGTGSSIGWAGAIADTWYHIVAVRRASNDFELYVNGISRGTDTTLVGTTTLNTFNIGAWNRLSGWLFGMDGNIDDVRIYNDRALGLAEIQTNYNSGAGLRAPSNSANLTAHWPLDDGTGTLVEDIISTNDGTIAGTVVWADGIIRSQMALTIDDIEQDRHYSTAAVPGNSSNWTFSPNNVMPYMEAANMTINGSLAGSWAWEYGANFTDLSGNGNTAIPTFRTTSSDADVSAELISFQPISQAQAPAYSISVAQNFIDSTPSVDTNFSTTSNSTIPGFGIIEATATEGQTPIQLPVIILALVGVMVVSLSTSWATSRLKSNSVIPKLLIVAAFIGVLVPVDVFDFWMLVYFLMAAAGFAMMKTHTTTGGESGYNLIGFLAMSFIGMTIINRFMEGAFINSSDVSILNNLLVFRPVNILGIFTISVPNLAFLTTGIPALLRWDYSFFGGNMVIFQYLFYSITAVVAMLLFVLMLGAIFNMLSRARL